MLIALHAQSGQALDEGIGGGLAGIAAAALGIVNNAPGTASPIPGLLAPFAFNDPLKVALALVCAIVGGAVGGMVVSAVCLRVKPKLRVPAPSIEMEPGRPVSSEPV